MPITKLMLVLKRPVNVGFSGGEKTTKFFDGYVGTKDVHLDETDSGLDESVIGC